MSENLRLYVQALRDVVERAIEPPDGYQISGVFIDEVEYEAALCIELSGNGSQPEGSTGLIEGRLRKKGRSTRIELVPLASERASEKVRWALSTFGGRHADGWGVSSNGTAHLYRCEDPELHTAICNSAIDVGTLPYRRLQMWR